MTERKPMSLQRLLDMHASGDKITMLTCYDAAFASVLEEAGYKKAKLIVSALQIEETNDLLAHRMDVEEMRKFVGADSLSFISMNGLYRAMGEGERKISGPRFCDACFSGDYPIALTDLTGGAAKRQLSLLSNVA